MYPKDYQTYNDNSNESPYSPSNDWHDELDNSTGVSHRCKHNADGTSEYDFGMGGGRVKYNRYSEEC